MIGRATQSCSHIQRMERMREWSPQMKDIHQSSPNLWAITSVRTPPSSSSSSSFFLNQGRQSYVGNLVHQNLIHLSNIYLRGFSLYSQKFAPHQQWFATGPRPVEHLSQESPNFYLLTEGKNKATLTFSFARAGCARSISAGNLRTKGSPQKS